jgi:CPA2 family monovalent cation:H+ antiporter-2
MFSSGLAAAEQVLLAHGFDKQRAKELTNLFKQHDSELLEEAIKHNYDLETIISTAEQGKKDLQSLFQQDKKL